MPETNGQRHDGRDGYGPDDLTAITAVLYGRADPQADGMDRLAALVERDRRGLHQRLKRLEPKQ